MTMDEGLTRREVMQGIPGVAAIADSPIGALAEQRPMKTVVWTTEAARSVPHLQPLNDDWRFHRGELEGAPLQTKRAGRFRMRWCRSRSRWKALEN